MNLKIFRAWTVLFHGPGGQVAMVEIFIMAKKKWEARWREAKPTMRAIDLGPVVLGVGLRL